MEPSRGSASPEATVLVVDDDPEGAARIAQELRRKGFDVAIAGTDSGAFESACHVRPTAIVVVLGQPAAGALPLVRQLATDSRTQQIPVIVARCEDETLRTQAQRIGNVVVLLGDCSAGTLAAEVDRVILESATSEAARAHGGFPVPCPKCKKPTGVPRSVSTTANGGTFISLRCEACALEWRVFRRADTPGFGRV